MDITEILELLWEFVLLNIRIVCSLCSDVYLLFVPPVEKNVRNKVILITGAGGCLGREMAVQLAGLGACMALCDIDKESLRSTGEAVQAIGGQVSLYRCDITSLNSVQDMANRVHLEVGQVSMVIHSAGIFHHKPFLEHTDTEIEATLNVNLLGALWVTREFLDKMVSSNCGQMVYLSSVFGVMGRPLLAPYTASKFAITGFCDSLDQEMASLGVTGVTTTIVHPFMLNNMKHMSVDTRIPCLFEVLSAADAATLIITAIRRDQEEVFIPRKLKPLMRISRCLPRKMRKLCHDFMEKN